MVPYLSGPLSKDQKQFNPLKMERSSSVPNVLGDFKGIRLPMFQWP